MSEKTIEQVKREMLQRVFEEEYALQINADAGANPSMFFGKDENGAYLEDVAREAFTMFRAGYNLANKVDPETGLRRCPFCGSKAERYPDGDMEGYMVYCSPDSETRALFGNKKEVCPMGTFAYDTQEDADAAWNNRA
jgi:hypothetical protein